MDPGTLNNLGWIAMGLGAVGALFNVRKMRIGFLFYLAANTLLILVGGYKHEWYNVAFFGLMTIIALYGYISWGTPKK